MLYRVTQNVRETRDSRVLSSSINVVHLVAAIAQYDLGKDKGLPRTGHEGPEGEQMYSCTLLSTSALDGGGWSAPLPGRVTPGKDPVLFV